MNERYVVELTDEERVGTATVYRTKRRFVEEGLADAIHDRPRPGAARKLNGNEEALLIATACSSPPRGRSRWTLELLAGEVVRLTDQGGLSRETVRRRMAENELKSWQQKMWCVPKVDSEYVARMEDVLDLYASAPAGDEPVISFDESPTQQIGEVGTPSPVAPGKPARIDYEYRRNGTANLIIFLNVHEPWRHVKVTDHRTNADFAVLKSQCLDRRMEDKATLVREVEAWENTRNANGARVRWMFTLAKAREKMGRSYPEVPATQAAHKAADPSTPLCRGTRGFHKIRHAGLASTCHVRSLSLAHAQAALASATTSARVVVADERASPRTWVELMMALSGQDPLRCPHCDTPPLVLPLPTSMPTRATGIDS